MIERTTNEFNVLVEEYVGLIRKYYRFFSIRVAPSLDRECEKEIEAEITRINGVLEYLERYMSNLAQYIENGYEYSFSEGFEVLCDLPAYKISRIESEVARVKYILEK
tara:strand:+ start:915 stop:1238 length:324 start_codon:yes stop_codon:yes gene_type:complete